MNILGFFERFKLQIIMIVVIAVALGAAWLVFRHLQNRIEALNQEVGQQRVQIEAFKATVSIMQKDAERVREDTEALNRSMTTLRIEAQERAKTVLDHDLDAIADKKPKLLEKRINKATSDFGRRLEEITRNAP